MKPSVTGFLEELYALDPNLRDHEQHLRPVIEHLLAHDPAQSPDPAFVQKLRTQLRERADTLTVPSTSFFTTMQKFFTIAIPAAAIAVIIPVVVLLKQPGAAPVQVALSPESVENAGSEAFGPLSGISPGTADGVTSGRAQGGGGGGMGGVPPAAPVPSLAPDSVGANYAVTDEKMMIAPYPVTHYEYVYDGELPSLTDSVTVYKRTPSVLKLPLTAISSQLNIRGIDINSFDGMTAESLSFAQNKPFGYMINIALRDATVNLDAQWDQWPMSKCTTDACYQAERVKLGDIPSDDQLITIAKAFVGEHGIDIAGRGEPEVDHQWKRDYDRASDKSQAYIPDTIRVVFPQLIDGKPVYDQSGGKAGIGVNVHIKHKRVMGVWGIAGSTYAKSDYPGVTDTAAIKTLISKLDNYPMPVDSMLRDTDTKTQNVTVHLAEPAIGYVVYFKYDEKGSQELLVPSLMFPVARADGAGPDLYYRTNVIVPLAKELFNEQQQGYPVPMMERSIR